MFISVLLPVYKESIDWITLSINSILQQSYENFELIIVLDNPDYHEARDFILSLSDSRIVFIQNHENLGLAMSLNKALKLSKGQFIARMDADDISFAHRFAEQIEFLNQNHDVDLVGTHALKIDENGNEIGQICLHEKHEQYQSIIKLRTVALHPTWMGRRELFVDLAGYNDMACGEDYDFLVRALDQNKVIKNIPKPLLKYRINPEGISSSQSLKLFKSKVFSFSNRAKTFDKSDYTKFTSSSDSELRNFRLSEDYFLKARKLYISGHYIKCSFFLMLSFFPSKWFRIKLMHIASYKLVKRRCR